MLPRLCYNIVEEFIGREVSVWRCPLGLLKNGIS